MPTATDITQALRAIDHPTLEEDIVSLGMVEDIEVADGHATIYLAMNAPFAPAEHTIGERVSAVVTDTFDLEFDIRASVDVDEEQTLPEVRNVIAVAAGKGGVGKTTVAVNLAASLVDRGARVGLLDADIHGPNVPRALPIDQELDVTNEDTFIPARSGDIQLMSMGMLLRDDDDPAILRGPMVNDIRTRFLTQVDWGPLDYLIIDLPPGTGDGTLDVLQTVELSGTVIVTTPHPMARDDARKAISMIERHDIPVLGVIENMASVACPHCDERHAPFGEGGLEDITERFDVTHLGAIPVHPEIGAGDQPVALDSECHLHGRITRITDTILNRVSAETIRTLPPPDEPVSMEPS